MPLPVWNFAFASAIGNSHIEGNIPCQDHCSVENYGDFIISVVCDGAGSCLNSHIGSQQVVQYCLYQFKRVIKSHNLQRTGRFPNEEKWQKIAKQTLNLVRKDLENYSIEYDLPLKSLACTIIVVIILNGGLLITHIGDGRAGYCNQRNDWFPLIVPFHGSEANETVFITSDIWSDEIIDTYIESRVLEKDVKAICLLSDGCEKAAFECNLYDTERAIYYDPNKPFSLFFDSNVKALPKLFREGVSQNSINEKWREFLTKGNEKLRIESDDKTLILGVKVSNELSEN